MENKFEEYLKGKLSHTEFVDGLKTVFGSPHRRTKVLENQRIVTHSELLELAELLDTTSFSLYRDFEVAADTLSVKEVEQLEMIFTMTAPANERLIAA